MSSPTALGDNHNHQTSPMPTPKAYGQRANQSHNTSPADQQRDQPHDRQEPRDAREPREPGLGFQRPIVERDRIDRATCGIENGHPAIFDEPLPLRGNVTVLCIAGRSLRRLDLAAVGNTCPKGRGRGDGPNGAIDRQITQLRRGTSTAESSRSRPGALPILRRRAVPRARTETWEANGTAHVPVAPRTASTGRPSTVNCKRSNPSGSCSGQSIAPAVSTSRKAAPRQRPSACQAKRTSAWTTRVVAIVFCGGKSTACQGSPTTSYFTVSSAAASFASHRRRFCRAQATGR